MELIRIWLEQTLYTDYPNFMELDGARSCYRPWTVWEQAEVCNRVGQWPVLSVSVKACKLHAYWPRRWQTNCLCRATQVRIKDVGSSAWPSLLERPWTTWEWIISSEIWRAHRDMALGSKFQAFRMTNTFGKGRNEHSPHQREMDLSW